MLFPLQILVVPRLQRRVNTYARARIHEIRTLAAAATDALAHAPHDAPSHASRTAHFGRRVETIYQVRLRLYRIKFFIKFFNNFIAQVTPFFFYAYGGWLVIGGGLSFGALLAALTAHKDITAPWKELLDYYQDRENAKVKYALLREHYARLQGA
jgi:putative ABC transport system ATP-binding protein